MSEITLLLGKISTVDSFVRSRAGAQNLVIHDEILGLLYRQDHTDVVLAGLSLCKDSVVARAKSNPLTSMVFWNHPHSAAIIRSL